MGAFSVWHWLIVLAITILLFGRGRISGLMGDLGKGLGIFRRELVDRKNLDVRSASGDAKVRLD